jgi:hypothetical protein
MHATSTPGASLKASTIEFAPTRRMSSTVIDVDEIFKAHAAQFGGALRGAWRRTERGCGYTTKSR